MAGYLVVFMGKTQLSQCLSPPGIINDTGGSNLAIDWYPIQGRVVILLVASCYMKTGISSEWVGK